MTKDKTTKSERLRRAEKGFKNHVKATKRKKLKHVRKQANLEFKASEEFKFRQHMARLLNQEFQERIS